MTTEQFDGRVDNWPAAARHPRFNCSDTQMIYQPILELLEYLRANQFETGIVSGGGQELMRVFAEQSNGIPPQQVIGSHGKLGYQLIEAKPEQAKQ